MSAITRAVDRLPAPGVSPRLLERARTALGAVALLTVVVCSALIVVSSAGGRSLLVPGYGHRFPAWLSGPLPALDPLRWSQFGSLLLVLVGGYLVLALGLGRIRGWVLGVAIVGLHLLVFLGPPLLSRDVFNYIEYARLGAVHHLNPYDHGAMSAPLDPALHYLGWRYIPTVYGPVYTLASYASAGFGLAGALWAMKAFTCAVALGALALLRVCALRLGRDAVAPVALVGLNPIWLLYAVGGVHNDVLMVAPMLVAIALYLSRRPLAAGASVAVAAGVKLTGAILLPFMLAASRERGRLLSGAGAGAAAIAALALLAFGPHVLDLFGLLARQQDLDGLRSVQHVLGEAGLAAPAHALRSLGTLAVALVTVWQLVRVRRGADWISAAGWSVLALLLATSWLMPWYAVWLLPLAALGASRGLRGAALVLTAYLAIVSVLPAG